MKNHSLNQYEITGFSERLRAERKKHNFTQKELSELLGGAYNYIARLEAGMYLPSIEILISLSNILDVSIDYLLTGCMPDKKSDDLDLMLQRLTKDQREKLADVLIAFNCDSIKNK